MSEENKTRFLALDALQIKESANGLIRKRWGVVKSLLNLNEFEGDKLKNHFFLYAENNAIQGQVFKHQSDALSFIETTKTLELNKDLKAHLKKRKEFIQDYLRTEGYLPEKKAKWKRILKF
ncbi:MAG: hypothetical protein R2799_12985 [Crocinitomicaceae bacterium]